MKKKIVVTIILSLIICTCFLNKSIAVNSSVVDEDDYYQDYYDSSYQDYYQNDDDDDVYNYKSNYFTERITDYDVEIYVNEDASMDVTEKITVYAAGNEIKHGIYRDFPIEYNNKKVTFDVKEVLLDDEDTKYSLGSVTRGVRIKIGDPSDYVSYGEHTYTIRYTTERQMAYYDDYDELYWNVIGSGWNFKMNRCHAKIYFPEGTEFIDDKLKTYTGTFGKKGNVVNVDYDILHDESAVEFDIYEPLGKQQAFTVSIFFEKGAIVEPTFTQKVEWFFTDNLIAILILLFLLILVIWQTFQWKKYGKDPKPNVIIPKYYPPEGFSPAEVKYIDSMGSTNKVLESSILNLAVNGYLRFKDVENKSYDIAIEKNSEVDTSKLNDIEGKIYFKFDYEEKLMYTSSFKKKLDSLNESISNKLKKKYDGKFFTKNTKKSLISIIVSILIVIVSGIIGSMYNSYAAIQYFENLIELLPMIFVSAMAISMVVAAFELKTNNTLVKPFMFVVCGIPVALMIWVMYLSWEIIIQNIFVTITRVLLILDNYIFYKLIRKYTEEGLRVKEDIEGFKMFINTAKDDDFAEKTPEMFDKYFPYAYALGLENKWADKFEDVLEKANYTPSWCSGSMMYGSTFNSRAFTSSFSSSFSSGMSAASTAPSSSGGSGGGGSSGGGGGGRWPEVAGKPL